jgi:D-alanyl-lipoteichoic acid acyltransferase DltB (MBOAT superfamily)
VLFNSAQFLFFFLPVALIGYQVAAHFGRRSAIGWLALISVVFYSWWNWHFVFVLLGSMAANFLMSRLIASASTPARKNFWLLVGITLNLGALCYFKYLFHILSFFTSIGLGHIQWADVVLPLGISFFTFTQIGYLVDLAQGQAEPQNIVEYALFVTFFPHLIAGPIIHHKEMMPQFLEKRDPRLNMEDMLTGISWFVLGLAKKCIIADNLAPMAQTAFNSAHRLGFIEAWIGLLTYSLQLYFDFSGYSDMAIGLSRMFSIRFPMNFNSPYKALDVIDFWQRWHMTLTRYLTLYLFNPISLSIRRRRLRQGKKVSQKVMRTIPGFFSMIGWPTIVTMVLVGIWHGAGFQFILFGLLHGIYLSVNHAWRLFRGDAALRKQPSTPERLASLLLTYLCVLIGQVFFRAASSGDAIAYLSGLAGLRGAGPLSRLLPSYTLPMVLVGLFIVWFMPNTQEILGQDGYSIREGFIRWMSWKPTLAWSVIVGILFVVALLYVDSAATFLYFQF